MGGPSYPRELSSGPAALPSTVSGTVTAAGNGGEGWDGWAHNDDDDDDDDDDDGNDGDDDGDGTS